MGTKGRYILIAVAINPDYGDKKGRGFFSEGAIPPRAWDEHVATSRSTRR